MPQSPVPSPCGLPETPKSGAGLQCGAGPKSDAGTDAESPLDGAQLATLIAGAGRGVLRILAAQAAMGVLAVLLSWVVAGFAAGVSALIGAGAYFIPNALFAVRVLAGLYSPKNSNPLTFFLGEAFKLGSTVLLLLLAAYLGRGWLVWPALLLGLVCVLKGYVLLFMVRRPR